MGFTLDGSPDNHAYMFIKEEFELPSDGTKNEIRFELYMEEKKWNKELDPKEAISTDGAYSADGTLQLCERVFLPSNGRRADGNSVLGIFVDDSEVFLDKGKYLDERYHSDTPILGVRFDNGTFVIDSLKFLTA